MSAERPPRVVVWLLRCLLPARCHEAVVGDLEEEWRTHRKTRRSGHAWFWREALGLAVSYRLRQWSARDRGRASRAARGFADDLLGAIRRVGRDRRFTTAAVLLLAAGIAVASALFSVVHAVLLTPLPYAEPDALVRLHESHAESGVVAGPVAPGNFLDWQARVRSLHAMAAAYGTEAALTGGDTVETIAVGEVTGEFFDVLGVRPLLGRTFDDDDAEGAWLDNAGRFRGRSRIVIDERLWRSRFAADPDIVGRPIGINGQAVTVIGVVPGSVRFPDPEIRAWVAWDMRAGYGSGGDEPSRNSRFVTVVARLAAGSTLETAGRELEEIAADLALAHARTNSGWSTAVAPLAESVVGSARRPLTFLTAAVGMLLLGVTASLAGMQLARAAGRAPEMAVRTALGARRRRMVRQVLLENLVLSLVAAGVGLLAGRILLQWSLELAPAILPRPVGADPAAGAAIAAAAVGVLAGLAAGLLPALRVSRADPAPWLRAAGPGTSHGPPPSSRLLVIAEIGLAVILVATTGLLTRSLTRLVTEDPGFDATGVLTARLNLEAGVSAASVERQRFFDTLLAEIADDPQVDSVGGSTMLPMTEVGPYFDRPYWRQGEPEPGGSAPRGWIRIVTPGFFESLRIPLRSGRFFDGDDRFDFGGEAATRPARVAIVNRTLARNTWPGQDPVGRVLVMDYPREVYEYRIVGVVEDVRPRSLGEPPQPEIYLPYAQIPYPGLTLAIRTHGDPAAFGSRLRALVAELNPLQPVDRVVPLVQYVAESVQRERFLLAVIGMFGAAALLLAALGVYGVVDLLVHRRTRELGLRMALGARPVEVRRLVLGTAAGLAAVGAVLGLGATALASRWMAASLYRTSPLDPVTLGVTVLVIGGAAVLAAWSPARRATRIEPIAALRAE